MRRQHTGREGSTVLGDDWATAHRAAAELTHTAACSIRHPGVQPGRIFNPATGTYTQAGNPAHYAGPCGVERLPASETTPDVGEETVPTVEYKVAIAIDSAPATKVGDLIAITSAGPNGDPTLVGPVLRVESVDRSSLAWERILRCSENQS